jgi:hypothetical protein
MMPSRQGSAGTHRHVYDSCYIASDLADTVYGWIRTLRARADKLTEHFWCPACRRAQSCSAARREHHHSGRTSSGPSERLGSSASMPASRPQAVLAARGPFRGRFRAWTGPTRRAPSQANPRQGKSVKNSKNRVTLTANSSAGSAVCRNRTVQYYFSVSLYL